MRTTLFTAFMATVLIFSSCKKKEEEDKNENIKKHYQGEWQMETDESSSDSTFVVTIDADGNFVKSVVFSGASASVDGNVNNNGVVSGSIKTSGFSIGTIAGELTTTGTGSGNFFITISSDTIAWTAVKL